MATTLELKTQVVTQESLASYLNTQAGRRRLLHEVRAHISSSGKVVIQISPMGGGDGSETLTFEVQDNTCLPG